MTSSLRSATGSWNVVEIAQGVAGPALGRILAALGHDVIKCEPPGGDRGRHFPPLDDERRSFGFGARNCGKRSTIIDIDTPDSHAAVFDLLASADVLITDLTPARARFAGLDDRAVRSSFPGLVTVSITGLGSTAGTEALSDDSLLAEAAGGLATMIGEPDRAPLALGGDQAGHAAGYAAFLGLCVAMARREATGSGDWVDVALADVAAFTDWKSEVIHSHTSTVPNRIGAASGKWRMIRTLDGWIGVIYRPHQWGALVDLVGDSTLEDPRLADEGYRLRHPEQWWPAVEKWAEGRAKHDIYASAQAAGLPFGYCATVGDLVSSEQLAHRRFFAGSVEPTEPDSVADTPIVGPLVRCAQLPWSSGRPPALGEHQGDRGFRSVSSQRAARARSARSHAPFDGVVVLDFGTITAGAAVSRLLADFGATVIKIESGDRPDSFRHWTQASGGGDESPLFGSNNAGKYGITLDLKSDSGRAQLRRLARGAHVVVENFRVGVTSRLGIDYETLHTENPDLLYLSLSSQGQDGPQASNSSYGSTLDLLSGLASVTGYSAEQPVWSSVEVNYPDQIVSLFGAGIVAYCLAQGIRGAHLDVSQLEVTAWTLADSIGRYLHDGTVTVPTGNRRPGLAPRDVYPCEGEDRWLAISCSSDQERAALADLIGQPHLAMHDLGWWTANADQVDRLIGTWTSQRDLGEAGAALGRVRVPHAPVRTAADRAGVRDFEQRNVFLSDRGHRMKGYPFTLGTYVPAPPTPGPALGEHTTVVLGIEHFLASTDSRPCTSRCAEPSALASHGRGQA